MFCSNSLYHQTRDPLLVLLYSVTVHTPPAVKLSITVSRISDSLSKQRYLTDGYAVLFLAVKNRLLNASSCKSLSYFTQLL